jgi:hypothetical protein
MVRVSAFKKVNPNLDIYEARHGQNWQLLLPLYYKFDHFFLDEPLYNYIIYKNSMSFLGNNFLKKIIRICEYEKNISNTLKRIKMSKTERKKYKKLISNRFFKQKKELFLNFFKGC